MLALEKKIGGDVSWFAFLGWKGNGIVVGGGGNGGISLEDVFFFAFSLFFFIGDPGFIVSHSGLLYSVASQLWVRVLELLFVSCRFYYPHSILCRCS